MYQMETFLYTLYKLKGAEVSNALRALIITLLNAREQKN